MIILGIITFLIIIGLMTLVFIRLKKQDIAGKLKSSFLKTILVTSILSIFVISVGLLALPANKMSAQTASSQTANTETSKTSPQSQSGLGFLAAALAVGLSCLGAGIAVGMSGAAAVGAISENPKVFGSALVFVVMGEGIAIYGIVIAILILARV